MKDEMRKEWFEKFGIKIIPNNEKDAKMANFIQVYWNDLWDAMFDWWWDKLIDMQMQEGIKRYNQAKEDGTLDKHFPTL